MGKREAERVAALTLRADAVDAHLARLAEQRNSIWPWMPLDEKRDLLACLREAERIASDPSAVATLRKSRPPRTPRPRDELDALAWLVTRFVGPAAGERCSRHIAEARARRAAGLPPLTKPVPAIHGRA